MSEKKKIIVVLGMHRSGTSLLTRGMKVLGVSLGNKLIPGDNNNENGYWEDFEINQFNQDLLSVVGYDWFYLSQIRGYHLERFRREGYLLRAVELIRKKIDEADIFCFKDPRTCKLLEFWKEVFSYCQVDVAYVLAVRNPLSVVKSLVKRDAFAAEHSYLLWLVHVIESLNGTAGLLRVIVNYDYLMKSPDTELMRVAKFFDLTIDPDELHKFKSDFIDERLRHTAFCLNDLTLDDACPDVVIDVYGKLLRIASDEVSLDDESLLVDVSCWFRELNRLKEFFSLTDSLIVENSAFSVKVAVQGGELTRLTQSVSELNTQIAQLNNCFHSLNSFDIRLNEMVPELNKLTSQVVSLIDKKNEQEREIIKLSSTINNMETQIFNLSCTLTERDKQIANLTDEKELRGNWALSLDAELKEVRERLDSVTSSNSWRVMMPLRELSRWLKSLLHKLTAVCG